MSEHHTQKQEKEAAEKAPERIEVDEAAKNAAGHAVEAATGTLGALTGAGLGAIAAGPPGAIAGGIIGAVVGAATGWAADEGTAEQLAADEKLDREIGVTEGTIGAPNLKHPPAVIGALSAEAAGANAARPSTSADADGPLGPAPQTP